MFIILEFIGTGDPHMFLRENGLPFQFITIQEALRFGHENCAFDFQVVELRGGNC